jgi:hypothetical protein
VSRSKDKGTGWETAICRYLLDEGFPHIERRALSGTADRGDLSGLPGWVLEAKNCKRMDLAGWLDEAAIEQANDGAEFSAVWHHRVGRAHPAAGYVTVAGATFVRLLRAMGHGAAPESPLSASDGPEVVPDALNAPEAPEGGFLTDDDIEELIILWVRAPGLLIRLMMALADEFDAGGDVLVAEKIRDVIRGDYDPLPGGRPTPRPVRPRKPEAGS